MISTELIGTGKIANKSFNLAGFVKFYNDQ